MTEEFVLKELQSLEDAKSVGLDGLTAKLLCLSAKVITQSVTIIFSVSIESGSYPDEWKVAKVVPIHKKGSIQDHGNFCPISILSTLSKVLERHIILQLLEWIKPDSYCLIRFLKPILR